MFFCLIRDHNGWRNILSLCAEAKLVQVTSSAKIISHVPIPGLVLLEYGIPILISPIHSEVNSALQRGTNTSTSKICTEWPVFPGTVFCFYKSISVVCTMISPARLLTFVAPDGRVTSKAEAR